MKFASILTVLLGCLILAPTTAFAHGGEDHAHPEDKASAAKINPNLGIFESATENVEAVLEFSSFETGKNLDVTLYLSEPKSNQPIADAKIDAEITGAKESKINFVPQAKFPGIYTAHTTLTQKEFSAVFSITGNNLSDLLLIDSQYVSPQTPAASQVALGKKAQFRLLLKTTPAKKSQVQNQITALGKVTASATGHQDLLAINAGRVVLETKSVPLVGAAVKKGDVLGAVESIGKITLKAPFDGVIAFADFHPGQWVEAGTKLFTVVDPRTLWIEVPIYENDLEKIKKGATASITIDSLPGKHLSGTVLNIGSTLDEKNQSALLTVEVPNPDNLIKVGQWAKVFLNSTGDQTAIVIPKTALLMKDGIPVVFVKKSATIFSAKAVEIAGGMNEMVFLSSSLSENDRVVTTANYQLLQLLKTIVVGE